MTEERPSSGTATAAWVSKYLLWLGKAGGDIKRLVRERKGNKIKKNSKASKKKTHRCACDGIDIFTPFKTCGAAANAASGSPKTRLVGPMSPVTS